jgi:cytochrome c-type biogenesis protein CcmE
MSKGTQIALGAGAIALLLGWYGYTELGAGVSYQYYQTLAEMRAAGGRASGESVRVRGFVTNDSVERDLEAKRVRFQVQNQAPQAGESAVDPLAVIYLGLDTPDLFKEGAEVVIEGRLEGRGQDAVFRADNLLAKCPSKFEAEPMAKPVEGASP